MSFNTGFSAFDEGELLTQTEMSDHIDAGTFRLGFVAMSNMGKSRKAREIGKLDDFTHYEVDDAIMKSLGFETMDQMADAMNEGHLSEAQYLAFEGKYTHNPQIDNNDNNIVFDTTGSVIYLDNTVQDWLKEYCLLVNIQMDQADVLKMVERYIEKPKPVIWGNIQKPKSDQDLAIQYEKLLIDRLDGYKELAHVSVPVGDLRNKTGDQILEIISDILPN